MFSSRHQRHAEAPKKSKVTAGKSILFARARDAHHKCRTDQLAQAEPGCAGGEGTPLCCVVLYVCACVCEGRARVITVGLLVV